MKEDTKLKAIPPFSNVIENRISDMVEDIQTQSTNKCDVDSAKCVAICTYGGGVRAMSSKTFI